MSEIKTFEDGTSMGTYSQINLSDGNKILISFTQAEIAIFKLSFLSIPTKTLWKKHVFEFIKKLPKDPESIDKSVLKLTVEMAVSCETMQDVINKFDELMAK